jgi:hypothetical protein
MGLWRFRLACVAVLCSLTISTGPAEPATLDEGSTDGFQLSSTSP